MSDLNARCLDAFPKWLTNLPKDATDLAALLDDGDVPAATRRHIASALNYLFKSLDLIPDGIEDLGFLDDAFVLRVAARLASQKDGQEIGNGLVARIAEGNALIEELLGADYGRLERYVENLVHGAARGRTTDEIVDDAETRSAFIGELDAWAASYQPPSFTRDEKNIVKLTSFLSAKLPA
ncbi:MAG: DUF1232 domain-containing protein [Polyangiaceae bacterium]|nr:DUF1232 domain-containing protein [Polyangiaceae bacterium]